jgi:hypothetical protein
MKKSESIQVDAALNARSLRDHRTRILVDNFHYVLDAPPYRNRTQMWLQIFRVVGKEQAPLGMLGNTDHASHFAIEQHSISAHRVRVWRSMQINDVTGNRLAPRYPRRIFSTD